METFGLTFQAVAALLGIGVLGFWIVSKRTIPATLLTFLPALAIDFALPCMVLINILEKFSPGQYTDWWLLPLYGLIFNVAALVLSLLFSLISRKETRREFGMSLWYQNAIFFPVIILTGLFGKDNSYLVQLFLFTLFYPSIMFSTYTLFFRSHSHRLNWRRIVNPVLVATLMGLALTLSGTAEYIPDFIVMIIAMLGAMAVPLFMLILGGNVYKDFRLTNVAAGVKRFQRGEVIKYVVIKNIVFPLVFLGILLLVRPSHNVAFLVLLQAAVPPVTALPIFAERCGGNRGITSQFIVASFLVSLVSIPAAIYLFTMFFPLQI